MEFEKLPVDGHIHSISVSNRRFELDPPVAIGAGQRVTDLISVDVLFRESDLDSFLV